MVDGLKLTITGEELRALLGERAEEHRRSAKRWKREMARNPAEQTEEELVLPEHLCENEADREQWRADVLEFLCEHLEPAEVYRLGRHDLEFGELLPSKPWMLEQEEYEERNRVGFRVERLVRNGRVGPEIVYVTNPDADREN
jgi:hypothetical protein